MTTQEKIEVMKAYTEGKKIQIAEKNINNWRDYVPILEPEWQWGENDYRIKPEEKYRPYKDTDELKADFFKDCPDMGKRHRPAIWVVSDTGNEYEICGFSTGGEWVYIHNAGAYTLEDLFKSFTYLDGSPCGIKEETN